MSIINNGMKFKDFIMENEATPVVATPPPVKRFIRYSGLILTPESIQTLRDAVAEQLKPLLQVGWQMQNRPPAGKPPELLPHHMTIIPQKELPPDLKQLIGTEQQMRAIRWGQDDKAAAVEVETSVPSINSRKHITVAVSPMGQPFQSNNIPEENWVDLPYPIPLTGIVEEV